MQLTEEQLSAIQTPGSLSVTASAGTGKTTVLTQRFLHCYTERRAEWHQIVAFTFTDRASHEMRRRILNSGYISSEGARQLNVSTIHAFCRKILLQYGHILGLTGNFEMHDESSFEVWQDIRIQKWLESCLQDSLHPNTLFCEKYGYDNLKKNLRYFFRLNFGFIPKHEIQCIDDTLSSDNNFLDSFLKSVAEFQENLVKERIEKNFLCYDDLELLTLRLFENYPQILFEIQKRFKHILVDEYQDVSPRQFELIRKMFNSEVNEIFIVGDPKQSIYGFRGTDSRHFAKMTEIITKSGGKSLYLHETFRTPQKIQDTFNTLFPKIFDATTFQPGISHQNTESGIFLAEIPESTESTSETHDTQALALAQIIKNLVEQGENPGSMAILGYTKNVLSVYKSALMQQGIPTLSHSPISLLENPLLLTSWHILNYLGDLETSIFDRITQVGMLRNPVFNFSESFIDHLLKSRQENIFFEQTIDLFASHNDLHQWKKLSGFLGEWRKLLSKIPLADLFQKIIDDIRPNLSIKEMRLCEDFYHHMLLWQKQDMIKLVQARSALKNLYNQNLTASFSDNHVEGVNLMSIHSAKGLEFDHVFLIPGRRRNNESALYMYLPGRGFLFKNHDADHETSLKHQLEESENFSLEKSERATLEREELARLIYVALTRVKKKLYIFCNKPSQTLLKALKNNPDVVTALKSYNDWLYFAVHSILGKS